MGSNSSSSYDRGAVAQPMTPQQNPVTPPPEFVSFLPSTPGASAAGLTPQMFAAIEGQNQPAPLAPAQGPAPVAQPGISETDLAPLWNAQPSMRSGLQKQAMPLLGGNTQGDRMMLASLLARAAQRGGNAGGQRGSGGYTTSGSGVGSYGGGLL
jgi:uncharacterized membrane protein YgcG